MFTRVTLFRIYLLGDSIDSSPAPFEESALPMDSSVRNVKASTSSGPRKVRA